MGLDTYLFRKTKDTTQRILNALEDKDGYEEVMYWRKAYRVDEWLNRGCGGVENCEYGLISKELFIKFIEYVGTCAKGVSDEGKAQFEDEFYKDSDYKNWVIELTKILNDTDWETQELYYHAWW